MNEYLLTDEEFMELVSIQQALIIRVGHIAKKNGFDPKEHDVTYDLSNKKLMYEVAKPVEKL